MWSDKLLKMVVQEYSGDSSRKIVLWLGYSRMWVFLLKCVWTRNLSELERTKRRDLKMYMWNGKGRLFNRLKYCLRGSLNDDSVFIPPPPPPHNHPTNAIRSQTIKIDTVEQRRSIIDVRRIIRKMEKGNKRRTIPTKTHHKWHPAALIVFRVGPQLSASLGKYHGLELTLNTNNYCRKNYFPKAEKRITNRYY